MVQRTVIHADALDWLGKNPAPERVSVVTSLPDISELPQLGYEGWRAWFIDAAERVLRWVPTGQVAIFFQTDVRHAGVWVDKGYLVARAAENASAQLVWHKVVCRLPAGTKTMGRAGYSHLLCFSRAAEPPRHASPDVLQDAGYKPAVKAMGVTACQLACEYLKKETSTQTVVDPFCGYGTVLAVANSMGFDALGIDISIRRCRDARKLTLNDVPRGSSDVSNYPSSGVSEPPRE